MKTNQKHNQTFAAALLPESFRSKLVASIDSFLATTILTVVVTIIISILGIIITGR